MHVDGVLRNSDNLVRGPGQQGEGNQEKDDGKNDCGGGIAGSDLPQAEDRDLREADKHNTIKDTLQNDLPSLPELSEFGAFGDSQFLNSELQAKLESNDDDDNKDNECDQKT